MFYPYQAVGRDTVSFEKVFGFIQSRFVKGPWLCWTSQKLSTTGKPSVSTSTWFISLSKVYSQLTKCQLVNSYWKISPVQDVCGLRLPPSSWWSRTGRIWVPKSQGFIRLHKGMSYYWNIEYSIWSDNHRPDCGPLRRIWNESIVLFSTSRWPCCYVHGSPVVYGQHYRPVKFK